MYAVKSGSMKSRQNTRDAIAERRTFKTGGALRGSAIVQLSHTGQLSGDALDSYWQSVNSIDYVVYSYATPIAWHDDKGWKVVQDKFSVTTTLHQSAVSQALHGIDYKKVGN